MSCETSFKSVFGMIPLLVPRVPTADQIYPYLLEIDSNQVYSNNGPLSRRLVSRLASYFGINEENITTLSNATLAIEGALFTSPSKSKEWDIPSWTFTATPAAALNAERQIRFVDVDRDWRAIPEPGTRNLIDVLPFGSKLDLDRLKSYSLDCILVDAAASFDALRNIQLKSDTPVGVVVSMHATKIFSAGEGGIFFSNDPKWVADVKQWSNFGMSESRSSQTRGTNAKLSEYAAAVALATLDMWQEIRKEYSLLSDLVISNCSRLGLNCFAPMEHDLAPYWILRDLSPQLKCDIKSEFAKQGIAFRDWWESGTASMPAYANIASKELINSDAIAQSSLGLPFFTALSENEISLIFTSLANALSK